MNGPIISTEKRSPGSRLNKGLALSLLFLVVQIALYGYVTIGGPTVVVGGGSATYTYQESCDGWDACYGYILSWDVDGGTKISSNSAQCVVDWDLSAGTHRLTANFCYNYMMSGNWYADYNSVVVNVVTNYTYIKSVVSNYTIDSTDLSDKNYIHSISPRSKYTDLPDCSETRSPDINESFQVIDGLGRVIQSASLRSAYNGDDLYQYVEFDDFGREEVKYLPFPNDRINYDDLYLTTLKYLITTYYGSGNYPYAETIFDESPLNRVLEQGSFGEDWQPTDYSGSSNGNTQKFDYLANTSAENIRIWGVSSDTVCSSNSCYVEGDLYVNKTVDEDGNESLEYKDHEERVILKEVVLSATESLFTYYVYDDYGLLRFVLPPTCVDSLPSGSSLVTYYPSSSKVKRYCYFYKYDDRKRVIEKQLPGADPIQMIYDKRDRLVASQDGKARANNKWLITKYDVMDRPVMTGIDSIASSRATLQSTLDNFTGDSLYEIRTTSTGNVHGYSNDAFPEGLSSGNYLTVMYYDSYDDFPTNYTNSSYTTPGVTGFTNISSSDFEPSRTLSHLAGQITGTKVKNLDSGSWYFTVNFYDKKGRLIQTKAQNHLGGYDRFSNAYDFSGSITGSVQEHMTNYDTIVAGERFLYDHGGRLVENYHQISGKAEILLASMKYNSKGQLEDKYLYSTETTSSKGMLQRLDYEYNIRGWLTAMNDLDDLDSDWFAMELFYNDDTDLHASMSPTERFNGNISAMLWKNQTNSTVNFEKGYCYYYDDVNRITRADYGLTSSSTPSDFDVTNITYDMNGNILSLTRRDDTQILDSLDYTYSGNQLTSVVDDGDLTDGFSYSGSPSPYAYDSNGNLIYDNYKGIGTIDYNYMNLPCRVAFSGSDEIEFIYDAAGNKLQKKVTASSTTTTTDYVGNVVYQGGDLIYIISSEGRLIPSGNDYLYEYHIKDHLGNTRAAFDVDSDGAMNLRQLTDYYPFGMTKSLYESSIDNNYLYNGKELQEELGLALYDYGARFYDPALGRFTTVDPWAENYNEQSPYLYAYNNPIRYTDYLGLGAEDEVEDDEEEVEEGDTETDDDDQEETDDDDQEETDDDPEKKSDDDPETAKTTEEDDGNPAGDILKAGMAGALGLAIDPVPGDEVVLAAATLIVAGTAWVGYEIYQFAQHGKNRGSLGSEELEILKAKEQSGTLSGSERQKLKRHEKNTGQRKSRQSKDKKK